jgi:hypothetical protein
MLSQVQAGLFDLIQVQPLHQQAGAISVNHVSSASRLILRVLTAAILSDGSWPTSLAQWPRHNGVPDFFLKAIQSLIAAEFISKAGLSCRA